jgi:hypothetical protein
MIEHLVPRTHSTPAPTAYLLAQALNRRICRILADELGMDPAELWAEAERIVHGRGRHASPADHYGGAYRARRLNLAATMRKAAMRDVIERLMKITRDVWADQ